MKRSLLGVAVLMAFLITSIHSAEGCEEQYRLKPVDCLQSVVEIRAGTASAGNAYTVVSAYTVSNLCHNWGTVVAHIDVVGAADIQLELDGPDPSSGEVSIGSNYTHIGSIACCIKSSDLCYKKQVEKNDSGKITSFTINGSTVSQRLVDVSTHESRYQFCINNNQDIYCRNNPDGDAFTVPPSPEIADGDASTETCGVRRCSAWQCLDAFTRSTAWDECTNATAEAVDIGSGAGDCHIDADCTHPTTQQEQRLSANYIDYENVSELDACVRPNGWGFGLWSSNQHHYTCTD